MFFFFNDTATTEIYTLSLHDALPISSFVVGPCHHRDVLVHANLDVRQFRNIHAQGSRIIANEADLRSEEHTSELQSRLHLVCRLLLEKKKRISIACQAVRARQCSRRN